MTSNRLIQIVSLLALIVSLTTAGGLLPGIIRQSDARALRYTNVSVENAPPFVMLGTAIGALRGLIVDYLWIKVGLMKDKGLYYEVMADSELITKLQPRFAGVWAFHGHNMAYNISVATHTQEERWEWVNAGIRLVRNEGLRYNPNDLVLHKELAFFFAHKIEGVSDDAHLYYKTLFCREWHFLLGEPPESYDDRLAWMKEIADAPDDLRSAEERTPGVNALVDRLRSALGGIDNTNPFELDNRLLTAYGEWLAVRRQSESARMLNLAEQQRQVSELFRTFDDIANDPDAQDAWKTLILHTRKKVLKHEYNMDPQRMYQYMFDLKGPIDWRHGQAHALYWSRRGSELGRGRIPAKDIYKVLNNDRLQMQAMQDLARWGRISYDPFSNEMPARFPDPRWIDVIVDQWQYFYIKHYEVRGSGGESFLAFIENFASSAIREWYRSGEVQKAQVLQQRMIELFGRAKYDMPLEVFVMNQVRDQYQAQPHLAPSEVAASLRQAFLVGVGDNRPEVFVEAFQFAQRVTEYFKKNEWNDYETKFGTGRIADIIGQLENSAEMVFQQVMTDPGVSLQKRMQIWNNVDTIESEATGQPPMFRAMVYDRAMPQIEAQYARSPLSQTIPLERAFAAPAQLEQARALIRKRSEEYQKRLEEQQKRDEIERRGT